MWLCVAARPLSPDHHQREPDDASQQQQEQAEAEVTRGLCTRAGQSCGLGELQLLLHEARVREFARDDHAEGKEDDEQAKLLACVTQLLAVNEEGASAVRLV